MIIGVGIDSVKIKRIQRAINRFGKRFLERVFCPLEIEHCQKKSFPYPCLAARFAVKEAFVKALGMGFRNGIGLKQICTINNELGAPEIVLFDKALKYSKAKGCNKIFVSITHEDDTATAIVILEC